MEELIHGVLAKHYDMERVQLRKMEGYDSTNYRVVGESFKYVLKIYDTSLFDVARIAAENEILIALSENEHLYPKPIPNQQGKEIFVDEESGLAFRLLTFLEGTFWAESKIEDPQIESLGNFLARMDTQLLKIRQTTIEATATIWDLEHFLENEKYIDFIQDHSRKKIVSYFLLQYKTFTIEKLPGLRKSIIHNDANDWNVLLQSERVSGIIDFGDMVYSRLINEIAIAGAYICMNQDDPVHVISTLLSSYHKTLTLKKEEIDVLYSLIAARLCTSVLNSAKTKLEKPESAYITVSEQGAWDLLEKWIAINPLHAQNQWRLAINEPIVSVKEDLRSKRKNYIPSVLSLSYNQPIHMVGAAFQYMYDADGNSILDAYNNIIQVGHCHPHVVDAGQKAMATLNTNTRYLYDSLTSYASRLLEYFPDHLNKIFLVNSGSAASDLSVRLAKNHTAKNKIIVLEHGYHEILTLASTLVTTSILVKEVKGNKKI